MLDLARVIRGAWEVVPILLLLLVGGFVAIRSGVGRFDTPEGVRRAVGNLSEVLLRVLCYGAALLMIQQWIGLGPALGW